MTTDIKETKASKVWHERVAPGSVLRESLILQFCHAVMPLAFGEPAGGHHTALTEGEAASIAEAAEWMFRMGGYTLTVEHTKKGLDWLQNNRRLAYKADITDQMIDGFLYFRWVGTHGVYGGWRTSWLPIWEINYLDEDGDRKTHEYWWGAWQSTGGSY